MNARCKLAVTGLLAALFCASSAWAQTSTTASLAPLGIYKLTTQAAFERGCFGPCQCPVVTSALRGTLRLRFTGHVGLYDTFAVTDVNWIASTGDPELRITGFGNLQVGGEFALVQRLQLELRLGTDPPVHFDSGLTPFTPTPGTVRGIDVTISMNGMACTDTVIRVAALPVPPVQVQHYTLGSTSQFQEGCFGACDCILQLPQPVLGTFDLVKLQDGPLFSEYSVSGINWLILGRTPTAATATTAGARVRGVGIYLLGGEVAVQQRLTALLAFDPNNPVAFDSGFVADGNFPAINIAINRNNMVCWDQVFTLHARPIPLLKGDLNGDGLVNNGDIDAFIAALTNSAAYTDAYAEGDADMADVNGDGVVNNGDIDDFVTLLTGGGG